MIRIIYNTLIANEHMTAIH